MTTFDKINVQAQVVNGKCPHCNEESILLVSVGALITGMAYVIFTLLTK